MIGKRKLVVKGLCGINYRWQNKEKKCAVNVLTEICVRYDLVKEN